MTLNERDYNEINETINILNHIKDDTPPNQPASHLTLIEYLDIAAFILLTSKDLFFNANGKPKNFMQLVGNIGKIIAFVRDLVRLVNRRTKVKRK